jgi:hypothetical protein
MVAEGAVLVEEVNRESRSAKSDVQEADRDRSGAKLAFCSPRMTGDANSTKSLSTDLCRRSNVEQKRC